METVELDSVVFDGAVVRTVEGPIDALVSGFRWSFTHSNSPVVTEPTRVVGTRAGDCRLDGAVSEQIAAREGVVTRIVPPYEDVEITGCTQTEF